MSRGFPGLNSFSAAAAFVVAAGICAWFASSRAEATPDSPNIRNAPNILFVICEDGSEELYDHRNDPLERKNLAGSPEATGIKQSLHQQLVEFLARSTQTQQTHSSKISI